MKIIYSYSELEFFNKQNKKNFVLLYKKGSEQSDCAFLNLAKVEESINSVFCYVDVASVKDIHSVYGITSVPSLLEFENGELRNIYRGCHPVEQLINIVTRQSVGGMPKGQESAKNVVVYSTPTCSWCSTLKNYLRDNHIRFRDVDVSTDERMAQEMVRKSGQQGVPQTEIDGQIVVGFDRDRINKLLKINN